MGNSHRLNNTLSRSENGFLKKKIFFCFRTRPRENIGHTKSHFKLPSVKYVYVVNYKSMIGGYRTLLVNSVNSVNPLLIPLRYMNHV
jgi:hypothetical protein